VAWEVDVTYFKGMSQKLLGRTEENHEIPPGFSVTTCELNHIFCKCKCAATSINLLSRHVCKQGWEKRLLLYGRHE
jgi:hypothetical protein